MKKITYLPESITGTAPKPAPLSERKVYDVPSKNPTTKANNKGYGKNTPFLGKNGYDKPLNNMSTPYGAYSIARRSSSTGSIAVNALVD